MKNLAFTYNGIKSLHYTRRLYAQSRSRPQSSKAEKDLDIAAFGTQKITKWMDKGVPATVVSKIPDFNMLNLWARQIFFT